MHVHVRTYGRACVCGTCMCTCVYVCAYVCMCVGCVCVGACVCGCQGMYMCLCGLLQAASLEVVRSDSLLTTNHAHCIFRGTAMVKSQDRTG